MKESKRVKRAQKTLEELKDYLGYYLHGSEEWKTVKEDIEELEKLLAELSIHQKKLFARALNKIKKTG